VVREVRFVVVSRPGVAYDVPAEARIDRLDRLELAVSSSQIRRELSAGRRPPEVPAAVMDYIVAHGLYGTGSAA
jgi:nicotinic acid mononucleotide adenylyltransferase